MRTALIACIILVCCLSRAELSGQHVSDHGTGVSVSERAVVSEVANKEHAIGHVEKGAVTATVNKAVEVNVSEKAAVITPTINVAEKAVNAPLTATATFAKGTVEAPLTVNVQEKAVNAPVEIKLVVPEKAFVLNASLNVADGAIQIRGAEVQKGAIAIPWWPFAGAAGLFGAGWGITKVRKQKQRNLHRLKLASHGAPDSDESSFWDKLF